MAEQKRIRMDKSFLIHLRLKPQRGFSVSWSQGQGRWQEYKHDLFATWDDAYDWLLAKTGGNPVDLQLHLCNYEYVTCTVKEHLMERGILKEDE